MHQLAEAPSAAEILQARLFKNGKGLRQLPLQTPPPLLICYRVVEVLQKATAYQQQLQRQNPICFAQPGLVVTRLRTLCLIHWDSKCEQIQAVNLLRRHAYQISYIEYQVLSVWKFNSLAGTVNPT